MTPTKFILPPCICGDIACTIPFGECHCGCKRKVKPSDRFRGLGRPRKGEPNKFIKGHSPKKKVANRYGSIDGELVAYIRINDSVEAIIDIEKEPIILGSWHLHNGYACQWQRRNGKRILVFMHKLIMGVGKEACGDHKVGNRLDNRLSQLRPATYVENNFNRGMSSRNTSGATGVGKRKSDGKWLAIITCRKKVHWLGSFVDFDDACKARKSAEQLYFGEFARNSIDTLNS